MVVYSIPGFWDSKIERNGETSVSHNTVSVHVCRVSLCLAADSSRRVRYVFLYVWRCYRYGNCGWPKQNKLNIRDSFGRRNPCDRIRRDKRRRPDRIKQPRYDSSNMTRVFVQKPCKTSRGVLHCNTVDKQARSSIRPCNHDALLVRRSSVLTPDTY